MSRRKYDGATIQERRKVDQNPVKVPPHKKERNYKLRVKYTQVTEYDFVENYTTKNAREQGRKELERRIKENRYWTFSRKMNRRIIGPEFEEINE